MIAWCLGSVLKHPHTQRLEARLLYSQALDLQHGFLLGEVDRLQVSALDRVVLLPLHICVGTDTLTSLPDVAQHGWGRHPHDTEGEPGH